MFLPENKYICFDYTSTLYNQLSIPYVLLVINILIFILLFTNYVDVPIFEPAVVKGYFNHVLSLSQESRGNVRSYGILFGLYRKCKLQWTVTYPTAAKYIFGGTKAIVC